MDRGLEQALLTAACLGCARGGHSTAIRGRGASAPGDELMRRFGFTAELVAQRARELFEEDEELDDEGA